MPNVYSGNGAAEPASNQPRATRRAGLRLLMGGAGFAVLVVGLAWLVAARAPARPVEWAVLESGSDGRSLKVVVRGPDGGCGRDPQFRLVAQTSQGLDIEGRQRKGGDCDSLEGTDPKPILLRLAVPLRGQFITGEGKVAPATVRASTMPRVTGLSVAEATTILLAAKLAVPVIEGEQEDGAFVERQRPAAGAALSRDHTPVVLNVSS